MSLVLESVNAKIVTCDFGLGLRILKNLKLFSSNRPRLKQEIALF